MASPPTTLVVSLHRVLHGGVHSASHRAHGIKSWSPPILRSPHGDVPSASKPQLAVVLALLHVKTERGIDAVVGTFAEEQTLARRVRSLSMNTKRTASKNQSFVELLDTYPPCRTKDFPLEAILTIRGTPKLGSVFVRFADEFPGRSAIRFEVDDRSATVEEIEEYLDAQLEFDWRLCCIDEGAALAARDRIDALQARLRNVEAPSIESIALLEELLHELDARNTGGNEPLADDIRHRLIRESSWLHGWTQDAPEVERARAYFEDTTDTKVLVDGYFGAWQQTQMLGDYHAAHLFARRLVSHAARPDASPRRIVEARLAAGATKFMLGMLAESRDFLEGAIEVYDANFEPSAELAARDGNDMGVGATTHLAWVLFLSGDRVRSLEVAADARKRAAAIGHTTTSAMATVLTADCAHFHDDAASVLEILDADASPTKLPFLGELATVLRIWATVALRQPIDRPIERMIEALDSYRKFASLGCPYRLTQVASSCITLGDHERASYYLDQARAEARGTGERFWLPEILRMQSHLARTRGDLEAASRYRDEGIAIANEQGSVALLERLRGG